MGMGKTSAQGLAAVAISLPARQMRPLVTPRWARPSSR